MKVTLEIIIICLIGLSEISAFYLNHQNYQWYKKTGPTNSPKSKYSKLIHSLAVYKRKLQNEGLYPKYYYGNKPHLKMNIVHTPLSEEEYQNIINTPTQKEEEDKNVSEKIIVTSTTIKPEIKQNKIMDKNQGNDYFIMASKSHGTIVSVIKFPTIELPFKFNKQSKKDDHMEKSSSTITTSQMDNLKTEITYHPITTTLPSFHYHKITNIPEQQESQQETTSTTTSITNNQPVILIELDDKIKKRLNNSFIEATLKNVTTSFENDVQRPKDVNDKIDIRIVDNSSVKNVVTSQYNDKTTQSSIVQNHQEDIIKKYIDTITETQKSDKQNDLLICVDCSTLTEQDESNDDDGESVEINSVEKINETKIEHHVIDDNENMIVNSEEENFKVEFPTEHNIAENIQEIKDEINNAYKEKLSRKDFLQELDNLIIFYEVNKNSTSTTTESSKINDYEIDDEVTENFLASHLNVDDHQNNKIITDEAELLNEKINENISPEIIKTSTENYLETTTKFPENIKENEISFYDIEEKTTTEISEHLIEHEENLETTESSIYLESSTLRIHDENLIIENNFSTITDTNNDDHSHQTYKINEELTTHYPAIITEFTEKEYKNDDNVNQVQAITEQTEIINNEIQHLITEEKIFDGTTENLFYFELSTDNIYSTTLYPVKAQNEEITHIEILPTEESPTTNTDPVENINDEDVTFTEDLTYEEYFSKNPLKKEFRKEENFTDEIPNEEHSNQTQKLMDENILEEIYAEQITTEIIPTVTEYNEILVTEEYPKKELLNEAHEIIEFTEMSDVTAHYKINFPTEKYNTDEEEFRQTTEQSNIQHNETEMVSDDEENMNISVSDDVENMNISEITREILNNIWDKMDEQKSQETTEIFFSQTEQATTVKEFDEENYTSTQTPTSTTWTSNETEEIDEVEITTENIIESNHDSLNNEEPNEEATTTTAPTLNLSIKIYLPDDEEIHETNNEMNINLNIVTNDEDDDHVTEINYNLEPIDEMPIEFIESDHDEEKITLPEYLATSLSSIETDDEIIAAEGRSFNSAPKSKFLYSLNQINRLEESPRRSDILIDDDDDDHDDLYDYNDVVEFYNEDERLQNSGSDETFIEPEFDEVEVLKLVPLIITQMKLGHITADEQETLSKIFGDLWSLIVEEANRQDGKEMNPILKSLYQSEMIRITKREVRNDFRNDFERNSINKITKKDAAGVGPVRVNLNIDQNLSPSQRILRAAVVLIQKLNADKIRGKKSKKNRGKKQRRNKQKRKQQKRRRIIKKDNPIKPEMENEEIILDASPETIPVVMRVKRSLLSFLHGGYYGGESQENDNEYDYYDDDDNDHDNDDDENDDDTENNNNDNFIVSDNKFQTDFYNKRYLSLDYENPSVNELILLAERHRQLRKKEQIHIVPMDYNDYVEVEENDNDDDDDYY